MRKKSKTAKKAPANQRYSCYDCGTEVIVDCCGVGFRRLVCCNKAMKKKSHKK